jgi:hypothetical protein
MNEHDMMYEGDGILRKPNRWDRIAAYERRARRLRAIYIGGLFARLLDWLESKARAAWRRRAEHYLAQASDLADLERRMRTLERRRELFG